LDFGIFNYSVTTMYSFIVDQVRSFDKKTFKNKYPTNMRSLSFLLDENIEQIRSSHHFSNSSFYPSPSHFPLLSAFSSLEETMINVNEFNEYLGGKQECIETSYHQELLDVWSKFQTLKEQSSSHSFSDFTQVIKNLFESIIF